MDDFLQDLRYGFRALLKHPGFTLVAVLTLALGIGANTAIFSIVNAVLLKPLSYPNSEELYMVWGHHKQIGRETASLPDFVDWREQNRVFENLAAFHLRSMSLTGRGEPERLIGARVTNGFLTLLRLQTILGRDFLPEEDRPGAGRVVLLSHGLWQRRFGADPAIINQTITLNGEPYTVLGVTPESLKLPPRADLLVPLATDASRAHRRGDFLQVVGRLTPGVTLETARAEMVAIAARLENEYPDTNQDWSVELVSLHDQIVGDVRPALVALSFGVGFVLLIACANVAHLLLARGTLREREVSIRAALGADRKRLTRQFLTESLLLAALGAGVGLVLAEWGVGLLISLAPPGVPRVADAAIDGTTLLFNLLAAVATGLIFGLIPAFAGSRPDLLRSLKESTRSASAGRERSRLRRLLVVGEVAVSLVLLMGAGLLIRSFASLAQVAPGFAPENLLTLRLSLTAAKYPAPEQLRSFYDTLLERVGALPGVRAVAAVDAIYIGGGSNYESFSIEGDPPPPADAVVDADLRLVTPSFHRTLGVPLLRGRTFTERDRSEHRVVVINQALARRYFAGRDPIGHRLVFRGPVGREIVGVVGDVRQQELGAQAYPEIQVPFPQEPAGAMTLLVRTEGDPLALAGAVRAEVASLDPDQPIFSVSSMEQILAQSLAQRRFTMVLSAVFALAALGLAAVGLYGLISYTVTERVQEVGIRMALGARREDVLRLVLGEGLALTLAGIAVGVLGALALTGFLERLLYGVSPTDPLTLAAVAALLVVVALLASYLPARRATRVDPIVALRYE